MVKKYMGIYKGLISVVNEDFKNQFLMVRKAKQMVIIEQIKQLCKLKTGKEFTFDFGKLVS